MKEWMCVRVGHLRNVAEGIEEYRRDGWRLFTYQATGLATIFSHYLLFDREG